MKQFLFPVLFITVLGLQAQENIDSLISSWNKRSADFIKVNETDSACKYGNCVVDMMDQKIERDKSTMDKEDLNRLKENKAEALSNLVTAYGRSDKIDLALEAYQAALTTYRELGNQEEIYHLNIRMGRVYDIRSSYAESIPYYQKACDQAIVNKDKKGQALCYYFIGLNNRYLGNYSEALKYHLKDLLIEEELGNKMGIADAYITIAAILNKLKDHDAAFEKLAAAKNLYEEIGDTSGIATVYNDMGSTFYIIGDTLKALQNHLRAAKLREAIAEYNGLGASDSYISRIYLGKGDHLKALHYLHKADLAFHNGANLDGVMNNYIEMSQVYLDKNDMDSTLIFINKAKAVATSIMNYLGLVKIYSIEGEIRLKQKAYKSAVDDFNHALAIAGEQNNYQQLFLINSNLAKTYQELGFYRQAFEHQSKSMQYKDSIYAKANLNEVFQLDMEYNYKREKIKNELQQEKKDELTEANLATQKTQKKLFFAGVLMFLMISLGLLSRLRYIRKSSRALVAQKEEAERHRLIAESESLRAIKSEKVKEQFLANMSHEIRTPMNAIKGITDIIIRNEHPKSQDKYLEAIKQSSEDLLVILNQILDLSKLEAGKIEPEKIQFEPVKIVENVRNILRFKAEEKGLKLNVEIERNIPQFVCGDPTQLNQILVNLASNAVKFTEKGSVTN